MTIELRPAILADTALLLAIEQQSFLNAHWDADSFLLYNCTVALEGGRVTGFCVSRQIAPEIGGEPAEREILNLAIHPEFRGHGTATALILNEVARPGTYFLEVRESNRSARRLYRKLGFEELSTRPAYYQNPAESAIVMTLKRC